MFIKRGSIMKRIQHYLAICVLLIMSTAHAERDVAPKFTIRSQGFNSVRRLPGMINRHIFVPNQEDRKDFYGTFALVPEYTRSFRSDDIADALFGDALEKNRSLAIQGSRVAGRNSNALLADYFYLPTDFNSCVCFTPRIQNFTLEFQGYVGLDYLFEGLYTWKTFTFNWTKWALNIRENVLDRGTNGFDAGYFTPGALGRSILLDDFREYALGNSPGTLTQTTGDNNQQSTTVQLRPLQFAKMQKNDSKANIADIRGGVGYNFLLDEDYHLGVNLQVAVPTGTRPDAEFLFEPQNGNDKHWEFGAGFNGHYTYWRSEDETKSWSFNFNADITHMFKTRQRRTFDLDNKPLSRYMLAEKLSSEVTLNLQGDSVAATSQFNNVLTPVANLTTFDVNVSVGVQADVLAWFSYVVRDLSIDFGYNFWGRSCEKIKQRCNCGEFAEGVWALKGDAHVYGFNRDDESAVPLSATNSAATIHGGSNFGVNGIINSNDIETAQSNPNIDNPQSATSGATILDINADTALQINTSIQPVFISQSDINFARTKGFTHKLFISFNYTWDRERWVPYLGGGTEVEFAQKRDKCEDCSSCDDDCKGNCIKAALSQWGLWLKGGVSFQ